MFPDEECGHLIDPSSGYCPQENRRKKQKTKPKPKEQSSQASSTIPSTKEDRSNPTFLPATSLDNLTPNVQRGGLFVPTNSGSGGQTTAHLPSFSSSVPSCGASMLSYNPPQQELTFRRQITPTAQNMQYGGLGQSPLFSGGGYLTPSIPSGSSTCSLMKHHSKGWPFIKRPQ